MGNMMEKWRQDNAALDAERRAMREALARLGKIESRVVANRPPARLVFGLDLTGSREASLKQARIATAAMFDTIKAIGRIELKLVHYRGTASCHESDWCHDADILRREMLKLSCRVGGTQIAGLLRLVLAQKEAVSGVVFVGDHCEEEGDELLALAQVLKAKSIPLFLFHECADHDQYSRAAQPVFERMAEASGGAYVEFKPNSGAVLRELLTNVAALSTGGIQAVERLALPATSEGRQLQSRLLLGSGARGH